MPKSTPHDVWLAHLEKLLQRRAAAETGPALAPEDLREIALEMGLTEDDLRSAAAAAEKNVVKAKGFIERCLWDDAIASLTEAAALVPASIEVHSLLAQSYWNRYRAETVAGQQEQADRDAAVRLAKVVLEIDPKHAPSFDLLAEIDRANAVQRSRPKMIVPVLVAASAVVLCGWLFLRPGPSAPVPTVVDAPPIERPAQAPPVERQQASSTPRRPNDSATRCGMGQRFSHDRGCFVPSVTIEPGVGLRGIVVGKSTPEEVLAVFGSDTQVNRYDSGEIFSLSYSYDGEGNYDADRKANYKRPSQFSFERGKLQEIDIGVFQQDIATPGGIHTDSTRADVERVFGKPEVVVPVLATDKLQKIRYPKRGIEFWIDVEDNDVNSIFVMAPELD